MIRQPQLVENWGSYAPLAVVMLAQWIPLEKLLSAWNSHSTATALPIMWSVDVFVARIGARDGPLFFSFPFCMYFLGTIKGRVGRKILENSHWAGKYLGWNRPCNCHDLITSNVMIKRNKGNLHRVDGLLLFKKVVIAFRFGSCVSLRSRETIQSQGKRASLPASFIATKREPECLKHRRQAPKSNRPYKGQY